jgi:hypothetical protein
LQAQFDLLQSDEIVSVPVQLHLRNSAVWHAVRAAQLAVLASRVDLAEAAAWAACIAAGDGTCADLLTTSATLAALMPQISALVDALHAARSSDGTLQVPALLHVGPVVTARQSSARQSSARQSSARQSSARQSMLDYIYNTAVLCFCRHAAASCYLTAFLLLGGGMMHVQLARHCNGTCLLLPTLMQQRQPSRLLAGERRALRTCRRRLAPVQTLAL